MMRESDVWSITLSLLIYDESYNLLTAKNGNYCTILRTYDL